MAGTRRQPETGRSQSAPGQGDPHPAAGQGDPHPAAVLDETVHQRHRLGVLAITSRSRQAEFGFLQQRLGLTSGNLSAHLTVLEDAGLVRVERGYLGKRPRTWVSITKQGQAALAAEMAALTELIREHHEVPASQSAGGSDEQDG
jgi:DNA-binding MarR family transcriptional regulator